MRHTIRLVGAVLAALGLCVPAGRAQVAPLDQLERGVAPLPSGAMAIGTGFFIAPDRILTSAHVLAGCRTYVVTNRRMGTIPARPLSSDPSRDTALLSTRRASRDVVRLAPGAPKAGATLSVLGFPLGRGGGEEPAGLSGRHEARLTAGGGVPMLSIRMSLEAGFSGGPVLDEAGGLVGIVVGRRDAAPDTIVALSADALPQATRRAFSTTAAPPPTSLDEAAAATVQIRCR